MQTFTCKKLLQLFSLKL